MNKKEEDNYKSYKKLNSDTYQWGDNGDSPYDDSMGFLTKSDISMYKPTTIDNSKGHDSLIDTLIQNMHSTNEKQKKLEDEHREALEALNQKQEDLRKFETLKASAWLDSQLQPSSTNVNLAITTTSQQLGIPSIPSATMSITIAPSTTNNITSPLSTTTNTTDFVNTSGTTNASATTITETTTNSALIFTTTVITTKTPTTTTTSLGGANGSGTVYVTRFDFVPPTQPESPLIPYMAVGVGEFLFALPPTDNSQQISPPDATYFEKVSNGDRGLVPMSHVEPVAVSLLTDYFKLCNLLYLSTERSNTTNPADPTSKNTSCDSLTRKGGPRSRLSRRSISQDHTSPMSLNAKGMGGDETPFSPTNASTAPECGGPGCESPFDLYDTELMDSLVAQTLSPSLRAQTIVPHPYGLMIEKQLKRSLLVSWCRPTELPATAVTGYQIILDGQIRAVTKRGQRTRALIEDIDFFKTHRFSVRSLTPVGHSHDAFCTLTIGRDSTMAPTRVRVGNVTKCSALVFWLASDTNISHSVFVNNIEVKTLRPGILMHKLNGLSPSTSYRVKVKAVPGARNDLKNDDKRRPASAVGYSITTQQRRGASLEDVTSLPAEQRLRSEPLVGEDRLLANACLGPGQQRTVANLTSATLEFKTLPGKIPEAPKDVVIEPGPQDGTFLLTWLPIPVDKTGLNDNSLIITGYAVFFDGRKVAEVSSPSGDHVLLDMEVFLESIPTFITVRTLSGELQSRDSLPAKFVERPEPEDDKNRFPADGTLFPHGDMDISLDRGDQGYLDYNNTYTDAPLPYNDREDDSRQQKFPPSMGYGIQSQIYQRIKSQNPHALLKPEYQQFGNGPRDGYGGMPTSEYIKSELTKRSTEMPYYSNLPVTSYDSSYPHLNNVWPYPRGPQLNGSRYQSFNDVYYDVPNMRTRHAKSPELPGPYANVDARREILPESSNTYAPQGGRLRMPLAYNYGKETGRDLPYAYDLRNDPENLQNYYRVENRGHNAARPPAQAISAPDLGGPENYYPSPPMTFSSRDKYGKEDRPQHRLTSTGSGHGPKPSAVEPVVVEAAFDYDPAYMSPNDADAAKEELPFRTGDRIQVLSGLDPDGFFVGRRLDFGAGRTSFAEGLVPSNMVTGPVAPSPRDIAAIRSAKKSQASQPRDSHHHTIPRSNHGDDNGGHKARVIPTTTTGLATASDTDASAGSSYKPQRKSSLQTPNNHDHDLEEAKTAKDSNVVSFRREKQPKSSKSSTGPLLDQVEPQATMTRTPSYAKAPVRGEEMLEQTRDVPEQRRLSGQDVSPRARLTRARSSKNEPYHPDDPNSQDDLKNASFRPVKQQREIVREFDRDYDQTTHNESNEMSRKHDEEPQRVQGEAQNSQYLNPPPPQAIMGKRESATGLPVNPATDTTTGPTKRMIALFDYDPRILSPNVDSDLELSFKTGDIILVEGEMDPDGFYVGRLGNMQGLVPSNFLKQLPPLPEEDPSFYDLPTVQKKTQKSKGPGEEIKAKSSTENIPNKSRRPISGTQSAQSSPRIAIKGGNSARNSNNVGQSGHTNVPVNDSHGQNESGFFSHLLKFTPKTG